MNDTIAQIENEAPVDADMKRAVATLVAAGVDNCYLAAPLTSGDVTLEARRAFATSRVAGLLMDKDVAVYSPLSHGWLVKQFHGDHSHNWWMRHCVPLLDRFDYLVVLCLPGWDDSLGVRMEIEYAQKSGKEVRYLAPSPRLIADFNLDPETR